MIKFINYNHRRIALFSNREEIKVNEKQVEVVPYLDSGYFFIKNGCFYDANGRFDYSFDDGLWKSRFLESAKS